MTGSISEEDRNKVGIETFHKMRENDIAKVIWDIRETELHYSLISVHLVVEDSRTTDDSSLIRIRKNDYFAVIYPHNKDLLEHANTVAVTEVFTTCSSFPPQLPIH
jgi:hypothetical protein